MSLRWLKRYLPRGLHGRATLILLLPVVTLFVVVSLVYLERYFQDVTQQMVQTASREIRLVLNAPDHSRATTVLKIDKEQVSSADLPASDVRGWLDLSGEVVIEEFHNRFDRLERVVLNDRQVALYFRRGDGFVRLVLDRHRVTARRPDKLLLQMLFFGTLMTAISYFYLRKQLRPITRLASAAEAFGRGRHEPYKPSGAREVRAAGNAFVDMRARIERHIEQRTLMLSGVSHDLRTPLTRLRLELALLDDETRAPMQRDIDEMERLLDAFLDFARSSQQEGPAQPTDPVALVRQVVEDSTRAGHDVRLAEVEGEGEIGLRSDAVRRAIENLVGNAVRYGSRAEVSVQLGPKSLRIRVEDDGPGIPPERRGEAMQPFTRLDAARNQNRGSGVGLGLSIVADIARAHGGTLRLGESRRLGGLQADIVIAR